MSYHPFVTRVVPSIVMRRERMLPVRGEVLVSTGSRVRPADIIARAEVPGQPHLLNVARALQVGDGDLSPFLQVAVGDEVGEGSVLAAVNGTSELSGRKYRSPVAGVVAGVSHGRVLIEAVRSPVELAALYRGSVINVMSGLGAIIEVRGALLQGIWGSGKDGFGVLRVVVGDRTQAIDADGIDMSWRGAVLVGGCCLDEPTLRSAEEAEAAGMILGALDASLMSAARATSFPVVVTEGMGEVAMSRPIFDLLKAYDGQEATIRGVMEARGGAVRPEVIIYASFASESAQLEARPAFAWEPGSHVRIVRGPYMGETGVVTGLSSGVTTLPSGCRARTIFVSLDSIEEISVAEANVELFG
jgi:hypothetical protein